MSETASPSSAGSERLSPLPPDSVEAPVSPGGRASGLCSPGRPASPGVLSGPLPSASCLESRGTVARSRAREVQGVTCMEGVALALAERPPPGPWSSRGRGQGQRGTGLSLEGRSGWPASAAVRGLAPGVETLSSLHVVFLCPPWTPAHPLQAGSRRPKAGRASSPCPVRRSLSTASDLAAVPREGDTVSSEPRGYAGSDPAPPESPKTGAGSL